MIQFKSTWLKKLHNLNQRFKWGVWTWMLTSMLTLCHLWIHRSNPWAYHLDCKPVDCFWRRTEAELRRGKWWGQDGGPFPHLSSPTSPPHPKLPLTMAHSVEGTQLGKHNTNSIKRQSLLWFTAMKDKLLVFLTL